MFKFTLLALTALASLSATPILAAQSHNTVHAQVEGEDIDTSIYMIGTNAHLDYQAEGFDQLNTVLVGTCPEGTKPPKVVFDRPGINFAIPYCE